MIWFPYAVLFLLGTIVASFMGVVVDRLNTGTSITRGRSKCDSCGSVLTPFQLVPILSYAASKGHAQCCGARVSSASTWGEVMLGALFAAGLYKTGFTYALPLLLIAFATLFALVRYDLRHMILPPSLLSVFVLASAGYALLSATDAQALAAVFTAAVGAGGFLALLHYGSKGRAMGFADAPFAFGLALIAGADAISGFIFSFWIGAVIGIIMLASTPKGARMGIEVPFAPFLATGFLLAYFTSWNPFILINELFMRLLGA